MELLEASISAVCPQSFSGVTGGLFLKAMTTTITAHCLLMENSEWPNDSSKEILEKSGASYDFIVVGAGTAGSLVASYLSNMNPSLSVLLVEAGGDPGVDSEIPAFLFLNQNSNSDWYYKTHPDGSSCLGFQDKSCVWSKGKCMGGSSSINAMLYIRGHPNDYYNWELQGNPGWGYKDLQKYFETQEKFFNITNPEFSGYNYEWYDILNKAWKELGYNNYNYQNHETVVGTKKVRILTSDGKRTNTARVYLKNARKLDVMKNAEVEKVTLSSTAKHVTGVHLRHSTGSSVYIRVKREIILSAGSIATPLILMRSGIGPKLHLHELGINCFHNLPVGKNLQDHIIFPIFLKTNLDNILDSNIFNLLLVQYILTRSGPVSNIGITDYMGFINTKNDSNEPDVQFHFTYFSKKDTLVMRKYLEGIGYSNDIINEIESLNTKHDFLGIYPTLLQPKSIGKILLSEQNKNKPKIISNYFNHTDDMSTLIKSMNFIKRLEKTTTFKKLGIEILYVQLTGCSKFKFNSGKYWECYIRNMATTIYHPVGTTKMGPKGDETTVVNNELLVHGINNLRVVDASVMPVIPRGNTMAATLVVAQKAYDIIKEKYVNYQDEL